MIPQKFTVATSRYQAHELIRKSGLAPIRITLGKPRMFMPYELAGEIAMLAPTPKEFRIETENQFAAAYCSRLDQIGVDVVVNTLADTNDAAGGKGIVLLCFDDLRTTWCHRRIFADWLLDRMGWPLPELC